MRIAALMIAALLISGKSILAQPNIVVVLVDDMRWDEYGKAGHAYIKTPAIDRVANEGITFSNAFCATPLCSPSRANFLTGQYAHTNGIVDNTARAPQSHQLQTFPRSLDAAGYETAFFGKWHMGNDDSPRPGFDHWVSLKGQGEATDPNLNINGNRQVIKGYVTDILIDQVIQFMEKKRATPFLVYLSHKALHPNLIQRDDGSSINIGEGGFIAADRHKGMYATSVFKRRPNHGIAPIDKPALMRKIGDLPPLGPETATAEQTIRDRAEMLLGVDESLGRIMNTLTALGQLDNTIIVFTSDHGYWYGEHGLDYERRLAYEESIRIPLLIRYPKEIPAGSSSPKMVQSIDLAPTLLGLTGVTSPTARDGRSLIPLFKGAAPNWRSSILIEYYSDTVFPRMFKIGYKAVRTERYKYIRYEELKDMDELYDLQSDPYELKNLLGSSAGTPLLQSLQAELNALLKNPEKR